MLVENLFKQYHYFSPDELKCKCGKCGSTGDEMDPDFMHSLILLRESCNFPFVISSAYRCQAYNSRLSDTGMHGPHTTGKAVDIAVDRLQAFTLLGKAYDYGFTGIGIKQHGNGRFIHLDTCKDGEVGTRPAIWSYS